MRLRHTCLLSRQGRGVANTRPRDYYDLHTLWLTRRAEVDEMPDGNDHSIDAVRYAMMDDVLRG